MILVTDSTHTSDGELVRLLDGECAEEEEKHLRAHLAVCAECRHQERELASLSEHFSVLVQRLEEAKSEPPDRSQVPYVGLIRRCVAFVRARRHVRLALTALLVIAATLGVSPLRAWVFEGSSAVVAWVLGWAGSEAQVQSRASTVSFVPTGDRLVVEFLNSQAAGTLSVRLEMGAAVHLTGGDRGSEILVMPDGVRIDNNEESLADYVVRIPPAIKVVEIRVAGVTVASRNMSSETLATEWVVDLHRPGENE